MPGENPTAFESEHRIIKECFNEESVELKHNKNLDFSDGVTTPFLNGANLQRDLMQNSECDPDPVSVELSVDRNSTKSVRFQLRRTEHVQARSSEEKPPINFLTENDTPMLKFQMDGKSVRSFQNPNDTSDLRLTVEGKPLYVSRIMLSVISPVLKEMFSKRPKDQSVLEMPLPDKRYEDMLEFLECVYPDTLKAITESNIEMLLIMSEEFKVASLRERCHQFLLFLLLQKPLPSVTLVSSLRMSIDFDFDDVRQLCMEKSKYFPSDVLTETRGYGLLTSDVILALQKDRLQIFEDTGRKICKRLKEAETHCGLYHKNERWGDNLCNKCLASVGKTAGFEFSKLF